MTNIFKDQKTFMKAMGNTVDAPDLRQTELYLKLTLEELGETICAVNPGATEEIQSLIRKLEDVAKFDGIPDTKQRAEIFDGVQDVLVTATGIGISMDFPMEAGWDEVLRSNMAKIGPDGKVKRREDGKVLKPDGWTPPDLAKILYSHMAGRMVRENSITATLMEAKLFHSPLGTTALTGKIFGDKKNRFEDGVVVRTSTIIAELEDDVFETKNSVYKVKEWA